MNSMKLAEENVKASLFKKVLNSSVLNCHGPGVTLNGQWSRKNYFNHCLTGWNSFQRLHIDVQADESEFSNIGAMCELDENEDAFSVYFDELEHYFTENGQKQHTSGLSNAREISRLCFKK